MITIRDLKIGESAEITKVGGDGALRQHFLDMGLIPGATVTPVKYAPMGDPIQLNVHGYELTLRLADIEKIECRRIDSKKSRKENTTKSDKNSSSDSSYISTEHPGLGEGGRYHVKTGESPLPEDKTITFALVGNQNSGKTTLFNQLTGSNQHVGNFPGVTVDRKTGSIRGHANTMITDLPGIYSLSPYSNEEIVTRNFILKEKPDAIINILDATNIERNLYLTMQLLELDVPVVVALNMMDEMRGNGGFVDINTMEALLGVPVVPISAYKNEGVDELVSHAVHVAKFREKPGRQDFCDKNEEGGSVHRCLHGIMHLIEDHAVRSEIPTRFAATKLMEGDSVVLEALELTENEKDMLEHILVELEGERNLDRAASVASMRFSFIEKLVALSVGKPVESRERIRSIKIDKILTGKYTAIPMFVLIMGSVFWLTFDVIGAFLQNLMAKGMDSLTSFVDVWLSKNDVNGAVHSMVTDGIFNGVGTVMSFLPIIVTLFFFLSLLEDTGYMARVAFVMDKMLRKIGLSGRSIVPMLIGFGCTVPAVMAARTLPSERDRRMTILLTPFMSCTAKVPIYAFFSATFFPKHGGVVMIALYFTGIAVGILTATVLRKTLFKGSAVPFVMELPNYRMPGMKNVIHLLWDKSADFFKRAFSIIFIATLVIWFLQTFNSHFSMVQNSEDSILAGIAGVIAPVFKPLGFGDWRMSTALIAGLMAKESVVSTLSVLFGGTGALAGIMNGFQAVSFLVFCLLYVPCVAAIASIKKELGLKWAIWVIILQCTIAWISAFVVYRISVLIF